MISDESVDGEKISVEKVLLLSHCRAKSSAEATELAFLQYIRSEFSFDGVNDALRSVCWRWVAGSREDGERDLSRF